MAVEQDLEAAAPGEPRVLDFSQPSRFTPELRRRVAGAVAEVCESLSSTLSAQLRAPVEATPGEVSESTWAAARAGLPADAVAVGLPTEPEGALLLSVEQPLVLQALECLLGGSASQAPAERRLSDIDWALAERVLDTVAAALAAAWSELGGASLRRGAIDLEGDAGISVAPGEPTLVIELRSSIDGCDSAMSLLLPWQVVEPLGTVAEDVAPGAEPPPGLRENVAAARVLLRAEIGSAQMPIAQLLAVQPGHVVTLADMAADGVRVFAEELSIGRGRPGRSGTHKALKIEHSDDPPVRAARFARLGRAELERARAHAEERASEGGPSILQSIFVRVWAELGRTHRPLGEALELGPGAVLELDQEAERPVELFANGLCFARGSLVVTGEGAWGVAVEQLM